MSDWSGKSRGGKFGYLFFISLLKHTNIKVVYTFIYFVAFYFLIFSKKGSIFYYFKHIHKQSFFRSVASIYKNYLLLGQTIIDKIIVVSGNANSKFTFDLEGEHHLIKIANDKKGGLLIGAHIGNWEIAGQLLQRIDVPVNVLMLDAEHEKIKEVVQDIGDKAYKIIAIKDDMSHLFAIQKAFEQGEVVVMHGDRFLPGASVLTYDFLGEKAEFPTGPVYLASKYKVPVSFVFTLKESSNHYHFYATEPKTYPYPTNLKTRKQDIRNMVQEYVSILESVVLKYPYQWFNYYDFWKK